MQTETHTPGPWEVIPPTSQRPSRATVGARGNQVSIYAAPLTTETQANAALIAAAPDLLAACKALFDAGQAAQAYLPHPTGSFAAELSAALLAARAAIAKAEGR